jgi:hypothetical protein
VRSTLEEVVIEQKRPLNGALEMEPEELSVVIDALGTGPWTHYMLRGPQAGSPDLFSRALSLIVYGIATRVAAPTQPREAD